MSKLEKVVKVISTLNTVFFVLAFGYFLHEACKSQKDANKLVKRSQQEEDPRVKAAMEQAVAEDEVNLQRFWLTTAIDLFMIALGIGASVMLILAASPKKKPATKRKASVFFIITQTILLGWAMYMEYLEGTLLKVEVLVIDCIGIISIIIVSTYLCQQRGEKPVQFENASSAADEDAEMGSVK